LFDDEGINKEKAEFLFEMKDTASKFWTFIKNKIWWNTWFTVSWNKGFAYFRRLVPYSYSCKIQE
jgi:hypothetical protein